MHPAVIVALLVAAVSVSPQVPADAHQRESGPFRVYVFTAVDPAKSSDAKQKARQDSVRDLEEALRQGGSPLMSLGNADNADITIEVMSREVAAFGQSVTTDQIDVQGKHRERSGRSIASHRLTVRLAVPQSDSRTLLTAGDLTWRSAAKLAIKQVQDWVKANGDRLRQR